jgi:hypothetical protein
LVAGGSWLFLDCIGYAWSFEGNFVFVGDEFEVIDWSLFFGIIPVQKAAE